VPRSLVDHDVLSGARPELSEPASPAFLSHTIRASFGTALLVLSLASVVSYRNALSLINASRTIARSGEILAELLVTQREFHQAELLSRGYVAGLRREPAAQFDRTARDIQGHCRLIDELAAGDSNENSRATRLTQQLASDVALLRSAIDAKRAGRGSAAQLISRFNRTPVDALVSAMEQAESTSVLVRTEESKATTNQTIFTILLSSLLAFAFICLAYVNDRSREEQTLRESALHYRLLFERNLAMVARLSLQGTFLECNDACAQALGFQHRSKLLGLAVRDFLVEPTDWPLISERLRNERMLTNFELRARRCDGKPVFLLSNLNLVLDGDRPHSVETTCIDTTERIRLELELQHAQKLESVGRLAAGIAHEINTPTQFVSDSVHFLRDAFADLQRLQLSYAHALATADQQHLLPALLADLAQLEQKIDLSFLNENVPKAIDHALEGLTRITSIVQAMKEFAHPSRKEMSAADLNRALRTTLAIARSEYKYVADVQMDLGTLPPVTCHIGDLNQVFLNLIVNSAHAIAARVNSNPGSARGTIRIATRCAAGYAVIEISDTGCGIPESIRPHIFEPFFTTKEVGKGTGQGLALARSIVVEKHGGTLTFDSDTASGTTFTVRVPVFPANGAAHASEVRTGELEQPVGTSRTIFTSEG
jgi:PAS domain S-box-containing protein